MISRDGGSWWHLHPSGQKVRGQRHYSPHLARRAMREKQSVVSPKDLQPVRHPPCARMPCLGSLQQAHRFCPVTGWSPLTTCCLRILGFDRTRITNKVLLSKTGSKGSRGNQKTNCNMILIFRITSISLKMALELLGI